MDTSLEIFAALAEAFDEEKECEHPYHADAGQGKFHGGKAEWYVQVQCRECRGTSAVLAMCDRWVSSSTGQATQCARCEDVSLTLFLVKEKIK